MKDDIVKFCPYCNSPDVSVDFSNAGMIAAGSIGQHRCNNCGYIGSFFPEMRKSELRPVKNPKRVGRRSKQNAVFSDVVSSITTGHALDGDARKTVAQSEGFFGFVAVVLVFLGWLLLGVPGVVLAGALLFGIRLFLRSRSGV